MTKNSDKDKSNAIFFGKALLSNFVLLGNTLDSLLSMSEYLHFQSKPLMNLQNFATVHSIMNDTKFNRQLPSSLAHSIRFAYRLNSPDVTQVL